MMKQVGSVASLIFFSISLLVHLLFVYDSNNKEKKRTITFDFVLISLPFKILFINFPSVIIKLEIAFINVSIVLNVKARAKIKIETIIKKLSLDKIMLKKAKSGFILGSSEKDIRPV